MGVGLTWLRLQGWEGQGMVADAQLFPKLTGQEVYLHIRREVTV